MSFAAIDNETSKSICTGVWYTVSGCDDWEMCILSGMRIIAMIAMLLNIVCSWVFRVLGATKRGLYGKNCSHTMMTISITLMIIPEDCRCIIIFYRFVCLFQLFYPNNPPFSIPSRVFLSTSDSVL